MDLAPLQPPCGWFNLGQQWIGRNCILWQSSSMQCFRDAANAHPSVKARELYAHT